jgi:hypothetical protein
MASYNLRKRQPNQLPAEASNLKKQKLNPSMLLLEDFPNEVLSEIFSYLGQQDLFLSVALVSKRFCYLTKTPQFAKSVNFNIKEQEIGGNRVKSLIDMLRINTHVEKLVLTGHGPCPVIEIADIAASHRTFKDFEVTSSNMKINCQDRGNMRVTLLEGTNAKLNRLAERLPKKGTLGTLVHLYTCTLVHLYTWYSWYHD